MGSACFGMNPADVNDFDLTENGLFCPVTFETNAMKKNMVVTKSIRFFMGFEF
jgi:hypothetical protein